MRVHRSCFFTFLNFFRESEKLLLIFLNESVIIDKHFKTLAGVMELADVLDSKSSGSDTVPVRPRSPAPAKETLILLAFCGCQGFFSFF